MDVLQEMPLLAEAYLLLDVAPGRKLGMTDLVASVQPVVLHQRLVQRRLRGAGGRHGRCRAIGER